MSRSQLAQVATLAAPLVLLGCVLPWLTFELPKELRDLAAAVGRSAPDTTANGFDGEFKGEWILILSLLGGVAALLVWRGITNAVPLKPGQLLLAGAGLYGLAAVLTLTDLLRDFGPAGRGFGLFLTLLVTAGAAVASLLAARAGGRASDPAGAP